MSRNNQQVRTDAASMQSALAFMISQATHIETGVYKTQYADLEYQNLIPIDTSVPEWAQSVTYFSSDSTGKADWLARGADDMPTVGNSYASHNVAIETAGVGYRYDLFEVQFAQQMGINLNADRATDAARAAEEMIDRVAFLGDSDRGLYGLVNQPAVTVMTPSSVTANGAQQTQFQYKTGMQILIDVNAILSSAYLGTKTIEIADTLVLPYDVLLTLNETFMSESNPTQNGTVLAYIRANNTYTMVTGKPLTIRASLHLSEAGEGGTTRMIAYKRDPAVFKMYMPMPFRFFPVWQDGPMRFLVPGAFRLAGVDVKRPAAFRYMDAI